MRLRLSLIPAVTLMFLTTAMLSPVAVAAAGRSDYIVVLKDAVSSPAAVATAHAKKHGAEVTRVYRKVIGGYAARLDAKALQELRQDPKVAYIERDRAVHIAAKGGKRPGGGSGGSSVGSWGLDRIDQHDLPLNASYVVNKTGQGVRVYVLDTGVRISHQEFAGRATSGTDIVSGDADASDCHGHGTHVAGTVAGKTYGVAKSATIVAVRVLDCAGSGSWSGIIAGLDWAVQDAPKESGKVVRSVVNMSIGGPASTAMDSAIADASAMGMTVVVAAGNESSDACNSSPARAPSAVTVGATSSSDQFAYFSNRGGCVDIQAPGVSIKSAWRTGDTATKTISGTSMASPHVAGAAALFLQGRGHTLASTVASTLSTDSTKGKLSGLPGGTLNQLLWVD